ncbi:inactive TPR repeat-containing thioredoxin TTL3-like [Solanum verrucosum]|uniref:inactive TPR repeat-containing thioredoxin TTL3-like n=1 Tax=Solanum verrucosum TaxID=315347 RepID=UPI0020D15044|nr:inactive TPR repeat-containing thioredoxin TTL3-like [Solanum verrucosum]XP_049349546.1 inactive TPR repeat-containing thioredoxin TTL3-like [Solanum verrucosum]
MAKIGEKSVEIQLGCGLVAAIFQRGNCKPIKQPVSQISKKKLSKPQPKPLSITLRNSISQDRKHVRRSTSDGTRSSSKINQSSNSSSTKKMSQVVNLVPNTHNLRRQSMFTSSDSSANGTLNRASSTGNIMLLGQLGNLKQQKRIQHVSTHQKFILQNGRVLMGNIVNKLDPDVLKSMGNEHYKHGRFEQAIALYNQAITINPKNACYYSNKSAALLSLNRLIEAVIECREAIQLDPFYYNAQYRLARLYLRLGEAEKALEHYEKSGPKVDRRDISEAQNLKRMISNCIEAQRVKDYVTLLHMSENALSSGADSAPQIFAMRAEALIKLHRHEEAYTIIQKGPNFKTCLSTRIFGSAKTAYLLTIRAQVYTLVGRFDDGISTVQEAAKLDISNEIIAILRRIKGVASARVKGNEFFKESKYIEACCMYTEGLEQDPYNSVLLFNRATCRIKLGQFEKGVEDCNAALVLRPSYTKARVRRADCYVKLERWEAAIQEFEMLLQEKQGDEEVKRALIDAKIQLKREREEDQKQRKLCNESNLVLVISN